jgi:hydrogenase expression/formation protein HypD
MKHLDEYRDPLLVGKLAGAIHDCVTNPWTLMEVCGGQTHNIMKSGIEAMLPAKVSLVHGPGCPVCVTPIEQIDKAVAIAACPEVIFTSYGDMLRVPGSRKSLFDAKAEGADVRMVYSPLDAVKVASANPLRQVVFFAVGFETTAPANATAVWQAARLGLGNFSILVAHVLVRPAMEAILSSPDCRIQGFLAPGHVCTITGFRDYEMVAAKYRVPIVVTGLEPVDILEGVLMCLRQLESGRTEVENQYGRAVRYDGNLPAQETVAKIFEVSGRTWRGIGEIPSSGLRLRDEYGLFDAEHRFNIDVGHVFEPPECISGQVLQGIKKPFDCPAFGHACTPEHPLGAPMVSSEGACAAYDLYAAQPKA